jgi:hypothetical protein
VLRKGLGPVGLDGHRLPLAKLFNDGIHNEIGLPCNSRLEILGSYVEYPSHTDPRLFKDAGAVLVECRTITFKNVHCMDVFLNHYECCILYGQAKGLHGFKMLPEVETLHGPDACPSGAP